MESTKSKPSLKKLITFIILIAAMCSYVGWVFYISEPKFIDNNNKKIEKYDYVCIPEYYSGYTDDSNQSVKNGIVMQVDEQYALIKVKSYSDDFYDLKIKEGQFRIIGKGTIYHKVNAYVGCNIMVITQIVLGILSGILLISVITSLKEVLD